MVVGSWAAQDPPSRPFHNPTLRILRVPRSIKRCHSGAGYLFDSSISCCTEKSRTKRGGLVQSSGTFERRPIAQLADIPEEEIWLAKQKSKRTRRAALHSDAAHQVVWRAAPGGPPRRYRLGAHHARDWRSWPFDCPPQARVAFQPVQASGAPQPCWNQPGRGGTPRSSDRFVKKIDGFRCRLDSEMLIASRAIDAGACGAPRRAPSRGRQIRTHAKPPLRSAPGRTAETPRSFCRDSSYRRHRWQNVRAMQSLQLPYPLRLYGKSFIPRLGM